MLPFVGDVETAARECRHEAASRPPPADIHAEIFHRWHQSSPKRGFAPRGACLVPLGRLRSPLSAALQSSCCYSYPTRTAVLKWRGNQGHGASTSLSEHTLLFSLGHGSAQFLTSGCFPAQKTRACSWPASTIALQLAALSLISALAMWDAAAAAVRVEQAAFFAAEVLSFDWLYFAEVPLRVFGLI